MDREDPSRCLDALSDGVELQVDLGFIGERPFVNNASFGAYAAVVQSPAYRDDKARTTTEVVVDADTTQIPVGVDGEALMLDTPVRCTLQPGALRVRVPRDRPGVPDPKPMVGWKRLWRMALTMPGTGGTTRTMAKLNARVRRSSIVTRQHERRELPTADGRAAVQRIRIELPKRRRTREWLEVLSLVPRDPDVVRAKALDDSAPGQKPRRT